MATRETWTFDGWNLTDGSVRDLETRDGLYATPNMVGANAVVAGRHGEVWRPKTYGPGTFTVNAWIGAQGDRAAFEALFSDLLRVVAHPERLILVQHTLASGETRECYAEVIGTFAPTSIGQQAARFAITFNVPAGFWRTTASYTDTKTALTTGMSIPLTNLTGSTAPMADLVYKFTGPQSNPLLTVPDTGDTLGYTGTIPAGASLTVDSSAWSVTGAGFTPTVAAVTHTDSVFLSVPVAKPGTTAALTYTGTGLTSASAVSITGRRSHLV
jgi:hypothetical protein